MKKMLVTTFVMLIVGLGFGDVYHTFTDAQGRELEAKVVSFDPARGKVELERRDGKTFQVPPNLFTEADQAYIKEWIAADRVLSDKSLRISIDKKKLESFKNGLTDDADASEHSKGQILCYEITLENKAKKPVEGLKIEYRYFVMVTTEDGESLKELPPPTISVDRIEAGESVTITTENLVIAVKYDRKKVVDPSRPSDDVVAYEYNKVSEDELLGIWLKIYGPPIGDEPSVRELCSPDNLQKKVSWED